MTRSCLKGYNCHVFSRVFFKKGKPTDVKKLGKKIKLARIELDLTQTQLTPEINPKRKSISRYETGASLPSIKTLVKIAKILRKPTGYFLDE